MPGAIIMEQRPGVSLPTPFLWFNGPNTTRSSFAITAASDLGSGAGSFTAAGANTIQDTCHFSNMAHVPWFSAASRLSHSAAASTWNFLHNAGGSGTISARFYLRSAPVVNGVLFCTCQGGSSTVGLVLYYSAGPRVSLNVCNGVSAQVVATATKVLTQGWHTLKVTKTGSNVQISIDSDVPVSGTITSPSASNASDPVQIGGTSFGSSANSATAYIADVRVWQSTTLDALQLEELQLQYVSRWSSVPGVRICLIADDIVPSGSNVNVWNDRSVGNNYAQATPANQPLFVGSWRNGRAAAQGGAARVLVGTTFVPINGAPYWDVYVVAWYSVVGGSSLCSTSGNACVLETSNAGGVTYSAAGGTISSATQPATGTACIAMVDGNSPAVVHIVRDGGADISFSGNVGNLAQQNRLSDRLLNRAAGDRPWGSMLAARLMVDHIPLTTGKEEILAAFKDYYAITPSP